MSVVSADLDTDQQPPMTIPLRHFLVGLGFLLAGALVGTGVLTPATGAMDQLAHTHLLLAGWVCVTIMGAMTQFVPVWSGTSLYSKRLASVQLGFVTVGLSGFVVALLFGALSWLPWFGLLVLAGFWTFVYNLGRTMATIPAYDVTERHFIVALGFFLVLTILGVLLAFDLTRPLFAGTVLTHTQVKMSHATLAVFGAVLTTVYGALYQLGTMFTQTELRPLDRRLQSFETIGHPLGVVLLATGRLLGHTTLARIGGVLVLLSALAVGFVLARKLLEMQVQWTPMHSRYAVVAVSLLCWAALSLPAWMRAPTAYTHQFGAAGALYLLVLGVIGFVVMGTLYHIVPFIVWLHRYSDRIGFEQVPMVDDLYSDRIAAVDFLLVLSGSVLLTAGDLLTIPLASALGGILLTLGIVVFTANVLLVVHEHSSRSLPQVVLGSRLTPSGRLDRP